MPPEENNILNIEQAKALDATHMAVEAKRIAQQASLETLMIYFNLPLEDQAQFRPQIVEILHGLMELA